MMPISVQFSAPEFHTWRRIKKWPANVTNTKMNTKAAAADAVNTNITNITIMITVMMTIADAMTMTAIATKAAPAMAEKTAMKSKKI